MRLPCGQADDFWQYALFAAVAYIRAAANRAGRARPPGMRGTDPAPQQSSPITTTPARE